MLQIQKVRKEYSTGDLKQIALDGVSLQLRDSEFVAILGPSGSGKTTLLNVIGGLDHYDSGDLIINGVSTKKYKDKDWDAYRNHTIGFVFQSYNLIPHQSILSNVELALTISGISKTERKKRAKAALEQVGLAGQFHKRPNQMSGGQMQRVAIARALVNNPDVLLADEPTGALDTETSLQVMDLLKEVAKDRLVIMVTHNPELANQYANRIVKLRDGQVIDDSNPFVAPEQQQPPEHKRLGRASMSFGTALSLSLNNLLTKKGRTVLTSFAGSIGIIGIALILSLSSGMQAYITSMQEDTLSTYPIQIASESMDLGGMMQAMMGENKVGREGRDSDSVYSNNIMTGMLQTVSAQVRSNDLAHFKTYLESDAGREIVQHTNSIQYRYDLKLQIYKDDTSNGVVQVNPSNLFSDLMGVSAESTDRKKQFMGSGSSAMSGSNPMSAMQADVWSEMLANEALLKRQYDVLAGTWPKRYDEIVVVVDENNELSDVALYSLGMLDPKDLTDMVARMEQGKTLPKQPVVQYSLDDLLKLSFKLVLNTDVFAKENGVWVDNSAKEAFLKPVVRDALPLKVVGVLRPNAEITAASISGSVAYTAALTDYVAKQINASPLVKEQKAKPETNVLTGLPFAMEDFAKHLTMADVQAYLKTLPAAQQTQMNAMITSLPEAEVLALFADLMKDSAGETASLEDNLARFGSVDLNRPSSIAIYPKDFEAKDAIAACIADYSTAQTNAGHEEYAIAYSDVMGIMMDSVTSIMNIITYVLIGFVAISLIVSSIMIGIITYISVLERTKEIGVLRSIGASKKDISRLFNAETVIEGLIAGLLGIGITLVLTIPINIVIKALTEISGIAALPPVGAVALIALSVVLTVIAGLLPSRTAAKKDPVIALRTE